MTQSRSRKLIENVNHILKSFKESRENITKIVNVDGVEIPITKILNKGEAYKFGFKDGYCHSYRKGRSLTVNDEDGVWALLKDGSVVGSCAGEPFNQIPNPSDVVAMIMSADYGYEFYNDNLVVVRFDYDKNGDLESIDLEFSGDSNYSNSEYKKFSEI